MKRDFAAALERAYLTKSREAFTKLLCLDGAPPARAQEMADQFATLWGEALQEVKVEPTGGPSAITTPPGAPPVVARGELRFISKAIAGAGFSLCIKDGRLMISAAARLGR
jgi:hypothetical protein